MHWWVFLELFWAMPDNTKLMQVIDIRGKPIDKKADKKYKAQMLKLKAHFAIDKEEYKGAQNKRMEKAFDNW